MENLKTNTQEEVIDLFWSGGWDSTFRLLQILLREKNRVQPHYMIWSGDTVGKTVEAMQKIRSKLFSDYPETKELMLPINYFDAQSIKPDREMINAFNILEESHRVGKQHLLLAQFCKQNNYRKVEQGTLEIDNPSLNLKSYLTDLCADKKKSPESIYDLFRYFRFPLINYEKKEMDNFAIKNGWTDIMYLTWFCRRPRNGRPCGFCGNCTDTVIHGMAKRLPLRARIIAYIQLPFRRWWRNNYKKRSTGIYIYIKKMLQNRA